MLEIGDTSLFLSFSNSTLPLRLERKDSSEDKIEFSPGSS